MWLSLITSRKDGCNSSLSFFIIEASTGNSTFAAVVELILYKKLGDSFKGMLWKRLCLLWWKIRWQVDLILLWPIYLFQHQLARSLVLACVSACDVAENVASSSSVDSHKVAWGASLHALFQHRSQRIIVLPPGGARSAPRRLRSTLLGRFVASLSTC